jgi:hypothetical protein
MNNTSGVLAVCATLVLAGAASAVRYDTNGDGIADYEAAVLTDSDNDGSFDRPGRPGTPGAFSDSIPFTQVWTSGSVLNNQWDAYCGCFDGDSLLDILGHHWNPNALHVFESDGTGGYNHVWQQTESLPPGSYCTVTAGDPDDDGRTEILGGEVSTLGKVVIFENVADDSWGQPYCGITMPNERIRTVRVADTNGNDTNEVIVVTGDATAGGKVAIFEHTGPPGAHAYTKIYEYATVSYLFQAEAGDADNDGYPEILLGVGGWHGFPMNIRRIVHDPATHTYSHHMFTSTVIGLPVAPIACRFDSAEGNLLVVGSSGDPYGQTQVFRYTQADTFQPVWTSSMTTSGNVIAVAPAPFAGFSRPLFFCAPFGGAVYGFAEDDTGFHCVSYFNPGTGAAIRSIDYGFDGRDELILAESSPADHVSVYRRDAPGAVSSPAGSAARPGLHVHPGVSHGPVAISSGRDAAVCILDVSGRLVARLGTGRNALWHGLDELGRPVTTGIYLVCAEAAGARSISKVVFVK